jgi:hypothetical protein
MSDPISRLQLAQQEIDKTFGAGFAREHPEVVCAVMASAASDYAALTLARSLREIAAALTIEEEERAIVPARELLRARP